MSEIKDEDCFQVGLMVSRILMQAVMPCFGPASCTVAFPKILSSYELLMKLSIKHPIGSIFLKTIDAQFKQVGAGVGYVTILLWSFFNEADKMRLDRMAIKNKPNSLLSIMEGYQVAWEICKSKFEESCVVLPESSANHPEYERILTGVAETSLGSRIVNPNHVQKIAKFCIQAVESVNASNSGSTTGIKIQQYSKKCGEMCTLVNGLFIEKEVFCAAKNLLSHPNILFLKDTFLLGSDTEAQFAKIKALNVHVVIASEPINPECVLWLVHHSIVVVHSITKENFLMGLQMMGGQAVFTNQILVAGIHTLGKAEKVEISEDNRFVIFHVDPNEFTAPILLLSSFPQVKSYHLAINETIRALVYTLEDKRAVLGGGGFEITLAKWIESEYFSRALQNEAVLAFAKALQAIPLSLIRNSGSTVDHILPTIEKSTETNIGWDCYQNVITDVNQLNLFDAYRSKVQGLARVTEAISLLLSIDKLITSKPIVTDLSQLPKSSLHSATDEEFYDSMEIERRKRATAVLEVTPADLK